MNTYAKFALAAAAVLVVAVVGYNVLLGRGGVGGPTATPSPSPGAARRGKLQLARRKDRTRCDRRRCERTGSMTYTDGGATGGFTVDLVCRERPTTA